MIFCLGVWESVRMSIGVLDSHFSAQETIRAYGRSDFAVWDAIRT